MVNYICKHLVIFYIAIGLACFVNVAYGDDVKPMDVRVLSPVNAVNEGTRIDPFEFTVGSKGDLRLNVESKEITWNLTDAPEGSEVLENGKRLWLITEKPGNYVVVAAWVSEESKPVTAIAWVKIVGESKPNEPTNNDLSEAKIKSVVTKSFTTDQGKKDAVKFRVAFEALGEEIPNLNKLSDVEKTLTEALDAVKWPKSGTYPLLSKLMVDLWPDAEDRVLSTEDKTKYVRYCDIIAKACEGIK